MDFKCLQTTERSVWLVALAVSTWLAIFFSSRTVFLARRRTSSYNWESRPELFDNRKITCINLQSAKEGPAITAIIKTSCLEMIKFIFSTGNKKELIQSTNSKRRDIFETTTVDLVNLWLFSCENFLFYKPRSWQNAKSSLAYAIYVMKWISQQRQRRDWVFPPSSQSLRAHPTKIFFLIRSNTLFCITQLFYTGYIVHSLF